MDTKRRILISIPYRIVLLAVCCTGLYLNLYGSGSGFMKTSSLVYYTIQSNIWVLGMTALYLALSIPALRTGRSRAGNRLQTARFAVMTGITLTFAVFWGLLTSMTGTSYLFSLNNLCVHTLVPLLFIFDFFLFDRDMTISPMQALWSAAMPMYYLMFILIRAAAIEKGPVVANSRFPYFFLDIDKYGWFGSEAGMGVFWWLCMILAFTLAIGYGYRALYLKIRKKRIQE